jgi:hypothetical protein
VNSGDGAPDQKACKQPFNGLPMTISIGNTPVPVSIRGGANASTSASAQSFITASVLNQVGKDPNALDTKTMHKLNLDSSFKDFDIRAITPAQMGLVSKNLFALGLIDVTTANLLVNAGNDLDNYGNHKAPNAPMNALDYFASRITNLQSASTQGNKYAAFVIPDYTNTIHVLQNLDDFAKLAQRNLSTTA